MSVRRSVQLAADGDLRMSSVEAMPESVFAMVYNRISSGHLRRSRTALEGVDAEGWTLSIDGENWVLPRAKDAIRISHIGDNPQQRVLRKYLDVLPQSLRDDLDVVIDVGAFIGEFSRRLEEQGLEVHAVEPDPVAAACLEANTTGTTVHEVAAWLRDERASISLGQDASESSLLDIDANGVRDEQTVQARRLTTLVEQVFGGSGHQLAMQAAEDINYDLGIDISASDIDIDASRYIDLVKIEAEGAEPEILTDAVALSVPIVIDVSPERYGDSPLEVCRGIFRSHGYTTVYDREHDVLLGLPGGESA